MSTSIFEPRWASAPAESIHRALQYRNWTVDDFSDQLGLGDPETRRILSGARSIDATLAPLLASILGGTPDFWLAREEQFGESTRALSEDEFAQKLPIGQMLNLGWISSSDSWRTQARIALDFFGAATPFEGTSRLEQTLRGAHYRTSPAFDSDSIMLSTWMRQAEHIASEQSVSRWNAAILSERLPQLRELTRVADPTEFIPKIRSILNEAGVSFVILRPLEGMRISGVAFKTDAGLSIVGLTARYLTDDHFWFSLFHEIGHLLLHPNDDVFIDEFEGDQDPFHLEAEANEFAAGGLVPAGLSDLRNTRANGPRMREVARFSSREGVAPGIVVGQLQHVGTLRRNQLNGLKRNYQWVGPDLQRRP